MSNEFAAHFRSVGEAAAPVWDAVTPEMFSLATPCAGWNVRELVSHTVTTLDEAALALDRVPAAGELAPEPGPHSPATDTEEDHRESVPLIEVADVLADPSDTFLQAVERLAEAVEPLAAESEAVMPWGNFEVGSLASMMLVDALVHTWDLGQAVGIAFTMPPAARDAAFAFSREMLAPELRSADGEAPFGLEIPVAEDASAQDRFLAWLGRTSL